MKRTFDHDPTLAEVADAFLSDSRPEERAETQAEIFKFIRWLGPSRQVKDISPVDVASYGELIVPSAVKAVKSFLAYMRKHGLSGTSLSPHLRARKASTKAGRARRTPENRATLTAQGYAELEAELNNLRDQLPGVIEEIRKAAADKDFAENAPLAAARERKAHLEGRIQELESTLSLARKVEKDREASRAKFGDTVVVCDLSSGKELCYVLVDPREANPARGRLSVASPLGRVVLDKEPGQTVEVVAPAGTFSYRIESIVKPTD